MSIPYWSFPVIDLGFYSLHTYGLMVALGMLIGGIAVAQRNKRAGISVDQTQTIVFALVIAGLLGARASWALSNLSDIASPIDVIAVWEGGLQLSGGLLAALVVLPVVLRKLDAGQRWHALDSSAIGLGIGLAIGRLGCYANGEHFGGATSPSLGTITYRGGDTIDGPFVVGQSYWALPLIEVSYLMIIVGTLVILDRRRSLPAGAIAGVFCVGYGFARFGSDFLRVYDRTFLGLTGAQYMCIVLLGVGAWLILRAARTDVALPGAQKRVPVRTASL